MPTGGAHSWGAGPEVVLPVFEAFQRARTEFAFEVAKLAQDPEDPKAKLSADPPGGTYEVNGHQKVVDALEASEHLFSDLRPLISDRAPGVKQHAQAAMGRLALLTKKLNEKAPIEDSIEAAVATIQAGGSPEFVKSGLSLLHACCKASGEGAALALDKNALPALVDRIQDIDASVKGACVWAFAAIANHDEVLAKNVLDSGALPLLLQCLKEPSLPLRRVTLACLGCIAKHEYNLAEELNTQGAHDTAIEFLSKPDMLLRRQACRLLAVSCQHEGTSDWVNSEARDAVIDTLSTGDAETASFAAVLLQQLTKGRQTVGSQLAEKGVVEMLVERLRVGEGGVHGFAGALGQICDASETAADAAVAAGGLEAIMRVLSKPATVGTCATMCGALGAIAKASAAAAARVASSGALKLMAESTLLSGRKLGEGAAAVARTGISKALSKCNEYTVMVWLLESLPFGKEDGEHAVLASTLKALARLMGEKRNLRLDFMQRGALTLAQDARQAGSSELKDALKALNDAFPKQMVAATDPNYEKKLLQKITDVKDIS